MYPHEGADQFVQTEPTRKEQKLAGGGVMNLF